MRKVDINQLLDIGIALSKEKDDDKLLKTILDAAMDITGCDGGTLYTREDDKLAFRIMITRSMGICRGAGYAPIELPPVPLSRHNVCALAALDGELFNISDVYESDRFDFSGPRNYDGITGYKTTSMLVIPMEDDYGEVIGVLQLINAQDDEGNIIPFNAEYEDVVLSLACQAAICLTKINYSAEVIALLDSFMKVISAAVDERTPYNANHTRNMVKYGSRFAEWLQRSGSLWTFSEVEKREFLMCIWMHDIGKLTIPVEIMDKKARLTEYAYAEVMHRFEVVDLTNRIALLSGNMQRPAYEEQCESLGLARSLIEKANRISFVDDELNEHIRGLAGRTYTDLDGNQHPLLTEGEMESLTVRTGTLNAREREVMQSHVTATERILEQMRFPRDYKRVPLWTCSHHEFLDGSGYPQGLKGSEIPKEVRLLTILDVFDALTARDRPYKKAIPPEKALGVLDNMVEEGKLDGQILSLFKESKVWDDSKTWEDANI